MNVLLVNDDGIRADGIRMLAETLSQDADIFVAAPDGERSGKSHSITIRERVYIEKVSFPGARAALKTSGTPADCTKIGLQFCEDEGVRIDRVFCGINHGSNLGVDTLYSGTVGAAFEAAVSGYRAAAVSIDSRTPTHFEAACLLSRKIMKEQGSLPPDIVVNLNCPDLPIEKIRGVRLTRLGRRNFDDRFEPHEEGGYLLTGSARDHLSSPPGIDLRAVAQGYCSVTPLGYDLTAGAAEERLASWDLTLAPVSAEMKR